MNQSVTWWVNLVLIFCHCFPHPSINSVPAITANTNASCTDVSSPLSYTNCTFRFLLSIFSLSLLFFLPAKARPLLMIPWEQRGELANHSSLNFTVWTVNVAHNQIVLCLQPFSATCWFDIYVSVTGEPLKWSGRDLSACYRWSARAAGRRLLHKS